MKISVVFVAKNIIKQGYCFWESLESSLPFADEIIVSDGFSEDDTVKYLLAFSDKYKYIPFRIYQDKWEDISYHGEVIANVSLRAIHQAKCDWIYYLQADEVIHENSVEHIKNIASSNYNSASFPFYHFLQSWEPSKNAAYKEAIRMIRRGRKIVPMGDAWNFYGDTNPMCPSSASPKPIYHFGSVFPKQNDIKDIEHSKIYINITEYQEKMRIACQNLKEEKLPYPRTDFDDFPRLARRFIGKLSYPLPEI